MSHCESNDSLRHTHYELIVLLWWIRNTRKRLSLLCTYTLFESLLVPVMKDLNHNVVICAFWRVPHHLVFGAQLRTGPGVAPIWKRLPFYPPWYFSMSDAFRVVVRMTCDVTLSTSNELDATLHVDSFTEMTDARQICSFIILPWNICMSDLISFFWYHRLLLSLLQVPGVCY